MDFKADDNLSLIMTHHPVCIDVSEKLQVAKDLMDKHTVRHVPVLEGKVLVGIISKTDIDRINYLQSSDNEVINANVWNTMTVSSLMTKNVNTVSKDDTIKDAAEILCFSSYHALPVTDGDDVVGIVTTTDLLRYLLKLYK
jgi:CBS domain-containing membrane protein